MGSSQSSSLTSSTLAKSAQQNITAYKVYLSSCNVQGFTESCSDHTSQFPPTLILILSRLVHDMERSTISYLVSFGDESFPPSEEGPVVATPMGDMLARAKDIAQVRGSQVGVSQVGGFK